MRKRVRQVWRASQLIELTKREYDLLEVLARNAEQVITQGIFFQRVWGDDLDVGQRSQGLHLGSAQETECA